MRFTQIFRPLFCILAIQQFVTPALGASLTFVEAEVDGQNGVQDLAQPSALLLTPDRKHVYGAGFKEAAVAAFQRNITGGRLSFIESQVNGQAGVQGLGSAAALAISPDGRHLYAAGGADAAVAVFARDATSGQLTF